MVVLEVNEIDGKLFLSTSNIIIQNENSAYILKVLLDAETALRLNDINTIYTIMKKINEV